jgi:hypothetical protein
MKKFGKFIIELINPKKEIKLNDIQSETVNLVKKIMIKPDSILLLAPISNICYIEWNQIFIRFNDNAITLTNSKFSYYVSLPESTIIELNQLFYRLIDKRKRDMEINYDLKTLNSLKELSNSID